MPRLPRSAPEAGETAIHRITEVIWIGTATDLDPSDHDNCPVVLSGMEGVLNCADDLGRDVLRVFERSEHRVEYAHVGLSDGPGNSVADYHAALLKLCAMLSRHRRVSVHDHDGDSRAAALVVMAMHALHRRGWDHWLGIVREKVGRPDLEPHPEHRRAFNKINWRLVSNVLE